MQDNIREVVYNSVWEEGVVETRAKLNLKTGEVFDIDISTEGDNYGLHINDVILTLDYRQESYVEQKNGFDYAIDTQDIYLFV